MAQSCPPSAPVAPGLVWVFSRTLDHCPRHGVTPEASPGPSEGQVGGREAPVAAPVSPLGERVLVRVSNLGRGRHLSISRLSGPAGELKGYRRARGTGLQEGTHIRPPKLWWGWPDLYFPSTFIFHFFPWL